MRCEPSDSYPTVAKSKFSPSSWFGLYDRQGHRLYLTGEERAAFLAAAQHFPREVLLGCLDVEADELWSFVQQKATPHWVWIAMEKQTRQIIAFHVGDRSQDSAKQLWAKIPERYREQATFYTNQYAAYTGVIPAAQHKVLTKDARKTNHIERFNNTLRQRVSRLVRNTLAFSKKVENHIGAIRYFISHYNLARAVFLV